MNLYFDCKSMNTYPAPGGPLEQTAFTMDLFNFLDGVVAETQAKNQAQSQAPSKP